MVCIAKMNKTELIARVQELEKQIEGWQEIGAQYGDAFETPQDIVFLIENIKQENEKKNGELEKRLEDAEQQAEAWEDSHNDMEQNLKGMTIQKQEAEQREYILQEEKDQLEAKELARDEEIIEDYFANEKLRETSWKEWNDLEQRNKHAIARHNEMVKEMDSWKQKFLDAGTQLRDANFKIEVFENYTAECDNDFDNFIEEANGKIQEDGELNILDGFHWEIVRDGETNEPHLQLVKNMVSQIKKWENVMESGDAEPELLLDAIAEKLNLTPIEWGKAGCGQKAAELWDKVIDTMEDL